MKIIDLTLPIYHDMPVYPGDPEVQVKQVHHLESEGWNLRTLFFTTHIATHVNVPIHMVENGKTLDEYSLEAFIGPAELYRPNMSFDSGMGVIFTSENITEEITEQLIAQPPKFVGLSAAYDFDVELERELLEHGIISFENLANTDQLPTKFLFYGVPLKIAEADGSPVRAFAEVR